MSLKKTKNTPTYSSKIPYLLFASGCLLVFLPTFFNGFQESWDDNWQLLNNPFVLLSSFSKLSRHFTHFYQGQYSPINTLLYAGIYRIFGFNATAFHTVCLLLHFLNVCMVYSLIKTIIQKIRPAFSEKKVQLYAFFVALVFAIHPLQVEAVAWISASKVVFYVFFTLAALHFYLYYLQNFKKSWLLCSILMYLLAFGTKEQAIILPLILLVFDYIFSRFRKQKLSWRMLTSRIFLEKIPFFLLAGLFWFFSWSNNLGELSMEGGYPFFQRLGFAAHSFTVYIFRFIAPVKLYYFYFFPIPVGGTLPFIYWRYLLLAAIILGFVGFQYKKGNKLVVFGFLFFLVNILLVLHLVPSPREMITADRYMYLSIVGLALISAWGIDYLISHYKTYKKLSSFLVVTLLLFFGVKSFFRTQDWKNSEAIKQNVKELIVQKKAAKQPIINNPLIDE